MKGSHMEYEVRFLWDEEASVWVATCDTVPGFVLESDSYDKLKVRVKVALPEVLLLNHMTPMKQLLIRSECRLQLAN